MQAISMAGPSLAKTPPPAKPATPKAPTKSALLPTPSKQSAAAASAPASVPGTTPPKGLYKKLFEVLSYQGGGWSTDPHDTPVFVSPVATHGALEGYLTLGDAELAAKQASLGQKGGVAVLGHDGKYFVHEIKENGLFLDSTDLTVPTLPNTPGHHPQNVGQPAHFGLGFIGGSFEDGTNSVLALGKYGAGFDLGLPETSIASLVDGDLVYHLKSIGPSFAIPVKQPAGS